ncbi:uncharacterized protein [Diabrotica undecimpunctata]|uniref:uncharacterized protein n=1 Tax=Diabrotica undecimpunctata TaxID=50387 RepID=UPI003B63CAF4
MEEILTAAEDDPGFKTYLTDKGVQVTETMLNQTRKSTLEDMLKTNRDVNAFTGIQSVGLLDKICLAASMLEKKDAKPLHLSLRQRIILVFVKLKTNLSFRCLSVLFRVSANTCKNYFHVTVEVLHKVLQPAVPWLSQERVSKRMPTCFEKYPDTRIILDCTEIPVEKNRCLKCRIMSYSYYKGDHTLKVLIGIAPSGLITFISQVYGGRTSDKEIFVQSNLINKLIPNVDAIMVDKGFLIEDECLQNKIRLIRPPFLGKTKQFSAEDALSTAEIAAARVHVERTIQRMKIFKILKGRINLYMVPYMDSIVNIIAGIVNLSTPILTVDKYTN